MDGGRMTPDIAFEDRNGEQRTLNDSVLLIKQNMKSSESYQSQHDNKMNDMYSKQIQHDVDIKEMKEDIKFLKNETSDIKQMLGIIMQNMNTQQSATGTAKESEEIKNS